MRRGGAEVGSTMTGEGWREWQAHWPLVLAAMLGVGLGAAHLYSMGMFIGPLTAEFNWSRATISSAFTAVAVVSFFSATLVGSFADRIGPRRVALLGAVTYCCAFASLATMTNSLLHWWVVWIAIAFSVQLVKPMVWTAAVASRFVTTRGLALAVALSGGGVASMINPIAAHYLIDNFGWRTAFVGIALGWAVIALPIGYLFFFGARDVPRSASGVRDAPRRPELPGLPLRASLLSSRFARLAAAATLTSLVVSGLLIHFVPMVGSSGLSADTVAGLTALMGVSLIVGRVSVGFLFDRFNGAAVGAAVFALPALACVVLLNFDGSLLQGALIAILVGFSIGADYDAAAYLSSRYFGLRHFGAIFGTLIAFINLAIGVGPLSAGAVFDAYKSYEPFLIAGIPLALVAAALAATLGPYPALPAADGLAPAAGQDG